MHVLLSYKRQRKGKQHFKVATNNLLIHQILEFYWGGMRFLISRGVELVRNSATGPQRSDFVAVAPVTVAPGVICAIYLPHG